MSASQAFFWPQLLKSKPRQREVNARDHRERGNHPQPSRPKPARPSLGHDAATSPITSAPSAAVAVQPYQYIAGARNPIAGSTVSREW